MKTQKQRAEDRSDQLEEDFEDMDDIIAKHYEDEHDDPVDTADSVLYDITNNIEHRHLRSFSLKEIEGNVNAYMEIMKEAKEEKKKKKAWHRPN